ncbi:MAG: hypothetical protein ABJC74_01635 [Gemmatimonadota bacterium]
MTRIHWRASTGLCVLSILFALSCSGGSGPDSGAGAGLSIVSGDRQSAFRHGSTGQDLIVEVNSDSAHPVAGAVVHWFVTVGDGVPSAASQVTDSRGQARVQFHLGANYGVNVIAATVEGGADTVYFQETAIGSIASVAGGNNVRERYSSDLTIHGDYAYTGSWNWFPRTAGVDTLGATISVFHLDASGAPTRGDSVVIRGTITLSDLQVSDDGQWLVASTEGGSQEGLYVYRLTDPAHPTFVARYFVSAGLHTSTLASLNEKLYAFTAKNPGSPALMVFDLSQLASDTIVLAATVPVPAHYGLHDTFVRGGVAFLFAWNTGVELYDVGNGIKGGSPTNPKAISTIATSGGQAHNGWWFWGPADSKQYLFVGQEGPGSVGSTSSGDIHVIDVSDLLHPAEVAFFHRDGAGPHNFWMDEGRQILYAAYYNYGVVAIDVSGTLTGDLGAREIGHVLPGGGAGTYTWGVQLVGSSLYDIDMLDGFRQLNALAP